MNTNFKKIKYITTSFHDTDRISAFDFSPTRDLKNQELKINCKKIDRQGGLFKILKGYFYLVRAILASVISKLIWYFISIASADLPMIFE